MRDGFDGPVWATEGTAALTEIVLRDSAHLNERDAEHAARGGWSRHDPPLPLYTTPDVFRCLADFRTIVAGRTEQLGERATVDVVRAGHVLGAVSVRIGVGESSVLFSGDLGRPTHPVLRARERPPAARTVVLESTYGDRVHPAVDGPGHETLAEAVRRTVGRGGSVLIPAFAVDRTELVLRALGMLMREGRIPVVPVHVDSPMALAALAVYRRPSLRAEIRPDVGPDLVDLPSLHEARTVEQSMALNNPTMPCVIVSASGMATGGRVVHHLRHMLPDRRNTVVLTGYQAIGTRGRALLDGASELKMHGRYVRVRAEVAHDDEFSVHADADELLGWLSQMPTLPETVYLNHGEAGSAEALAARIRADLDIAVVVPRLGERVLLD